MALDQEARTQRFCRTLTEWYAPSDCVSLGDGLYRMKRCYRHFTYQKLAHVSKLMHGLRNIAHATEFLNVLEDGQYLGIVEDPTSVWLQRTSDSEERFLLAIDVLDGDGDGVRNVIDVKDIYCYMSPPHAGAIFIAQTKSQKQSPLYTITVPMGPLTTDDIVHGSLLQRVRNLCHQHRL